MAQITETVPFTFDDIYSSVMKKFTDKGYDVEEGSNTAQLVTAMSYLTSMLNVNTAVNINELLLPYARKRDNAAMSAKTLGYEPSHKQSYKYRLSLKMNAGNYSIPKYSVFQVDGKKYYYVGNQLDLQNIEQDTIIQIDVKEGDLYLSTAYPDNLVITTTTVTNDIGVLVPQYYIDIPFIDVEEDGIEVFVSYYDDFGNLNTMEQWYQTKTFLIDNDTVLKKQFVRMDDIKFKTPRIYFQVAGLGDGVRVGSTVNINLLVSNGVNGAISDLTNYSALSNPIYGSEIVGIDLVTQGTDEESLESIQQNAPLFHNSANRAVTKFDYETICNRHPSVKTSMVWGGDEEYPKCPGHIWFSFLPSTYERTFNVDSYSNEFNVNYNGDFTWDYSLSSDSDEYLIQYNNSKEYYSNWFLEKSEIKSYEYTSNGQLIDPGVWDVLENYKIPTLEFHNRHPLYIDFEYDIQVLKYNINTSKSDIHNGLFNVIDNSFTGTDDSLHLEKFDTEYFNSSLVKRIDQTVTDISGIDLSITTKISLSNKNVSKENILSEFRDIFIPLQIPFEKYFDNDGYLLYNKLPNIDTNDFIEYYGETGFNIYTDWSDIQNDIENSITQESSDVITAPIRVHQETNITISANSQVEIEIPSDDLVELFGDYPEDSIPTYNNVKVKLNGTTLTYGAVTNGFSVEESKLIILSGVTTNIGDVVNIQIERHAGRYYLFNTYRKSIIVQLYVNASGFIDESLTTSDLDSPKSYLTTLEGFYAFTNDTYYLTTEGYAIVDDSQTNAVTGGVVKEMVPELYEQTPIKMNLFNKNRYLNFKYASNNFLLSKNLIPRLKRVTFLQGV